MTSQVTDYIFDIPLRTEAELRLYVKHAFGIIVPDKQICDDHVSPWRAFADAYFARYPVSVWKASRGFGGKTFTLALLGLTEATTLKADVNVLGGSGEQSERVLEHTQTFWGHDNAPRQLLASDPSQRITRLVWGNKIRALLASQKSVRGPHPQRLRMDEIDEMELDILDAAMGQPMRGATDITPQTVLSSTHQYADGTMTEILRRAGEKGWNYQEWCYRETLHPHGWLHPAEIEQKRAEVTASMWDVEYEGQEPSPESRAIQSEAVEAMFDAKLGVFDGALHEYIQIEEPFANHPYAHGTDWARKHDYTVIVTLRTDVRPMRVVAFERTHRLDWPVMVDKLNERIRYWGGTSMHDGTGIGDVVGQYLDQPSEGFLFTGQQRKDLLSEYIAAIENRDIVCPRIKYMYNEHRLASVEDVYSSTQKHHLPDSIAAGALMWRASNSGFDASSMSDLGHVEGVKSRWRE